MNHSKNFKLSYNTAFFCNKGEDYYYFLGASLADGCVCVKNAKTQKLKFSLISKDKNWLTLLQSRIGGSVTKMSKNCDSLNIYHQDIINQLVSDGCVPRKSLIITLPDIPKIYFIDLLRGLTDGDGCIVFSTHKRKTKNRVYSERTPHWYLCSANKSFLEQIQNILISQFNIKCRIVLSTKKGKLHTVSDGREIVSKQDCYRLCCGNRQTFNLLKVLGYDNDLSLAMPRKQHIAKEIISYYESDMFHQFRKKREIIKT